MGIPSIQIRGDFPSHPEHLQEPGQEAWYRGGEFWVEGLITSRDIPLWTIYCEQFDRIASYKADILSDGDFQMTDKGTYIAHPALRQVQIAESRIVEISKALGVTTLAKKEKPKKDQQTKQFGVSQRKR
jgi:P27 family predicted phage terminase small subunit